MGRTLPAALTIGAATVVVVVLGLAGVAQAHVTVNPGQAVQGEEARVAFWVPTVVSLAGLVLGGLAFVRPPRHLRRLRGWVY
jgi:hypothetical protein